MIDDDYCAGGQDDVASTAAPETKNSLHCDILSFGE